MMLNFKPQALDRETLRAQAAESINYTPAAPVRTVTIPARVEHEGIYERTVTLIWRCPVCGKPRGNVSPIASYDGSRHMIVDGWTNECGHVDKYSDVRKEAASNGLNEAQNTPADVGAYMEQDSLQQAEIDERGAYGYCELTTDDLRELIHVGCTVRYHFSGYGSFEGDVTALCLEKDRAEVRFEDNFGMRKFWCALDRLELLLCKNAREVEAG